MRFLKGRWLVWWPVCQQETDRLEPGKMDLRNVIPRIQLPHKVKVSVIFPPTSDWILNTETDLHLKPYIYDT